jgi:cytochrome c peroxidase
VVVGAVVAGASVVRRGPSRLSAAPPAPPPVNGAAVRRTLSSWVDSLDAHLALLESSGNRHDPKLTRRRVFRIARRDFKRMEGILAYYSPPMVAALNSNEAEEEGDDTADGYHVLRGFQLLEDRLFGGDEVKDWGPASTELRTMRLTTQRYRTVIPLIATTDMECLEIARLELARVATVGIAGFDASLSQDGIPESAEAIDGLLALPCVGTGTGEPSASLSAAARYLREHPGFESFDRFTFVQKFANPAFDALASAAASARRRSGVAPLPHRRTWPDGVASVYDARGFDVGSYDLTGRRSSPRPDVVALGRELFFEPALSGNGARACATCHIPERAFTDGLARAARLDGHKSSLRNTPSLVNAAMQPAQFLDERRVTLEQQAGDVLASAAEMASSADIAARHLAAIPAYRDRIKSGADVREALAAYIRSLTALNAPFDRALRGEVALGADARRGFNVFMGKARCGTCHFAPLFGGTLPPEFVMSDPEIIGVPARNVTRGATIDPDSGRGAIDRRGGMAHAFKTPTVRNTALTAPYMHNGAFRTLKDVIDFYDRGGGLGVGAKVPNQTLSPDSLHLTATDRRALIAFLQSLTDTTGLTARPIPRAAMASSSPPTH